MTNETKIIESLSNLQWNEKKSQIIKIGNDKFCQIFFAIKRKIEYFIQFNNWDIEN